MFCRFVSCKVTLCSFVPNGYFLRSYFETYYALFHKSVIYLISFIYVNERIKILLLCSSRSQFGFISFTISLIIMQDIFSKLLILYVLYLQMKTCHFTIWLASFPLGKWQKIRTKSWMSRLLWEGIDDRSLLCDKHKHEHLKHPCHQLYPCIVKTMSYHQ